MSTDDKKTDDIADSFEDTELPDIHLGSPLEKDAGLPMVVVLTTSGRIYIGAYCPTDDEIELGLLISHPLLMLEVLREDKTKIDVFMHKVLMTLSMRDQINVRHETLMFLRSDSAMDKKLVLLYESEIQKHSFVDAGLVAPTQQDISKLAKA